MIIIINVKFLVIIIKYRTINAPHQVKGYQAHIFEITASIRFLFWSYNVSPGAITISRPKVQDLNSNYMTSHSCSLFFPGF